MLDLVLPGKDATIFSAVYALILLHSTYSTQYDTLYRDRHKETQSLTFLSFIVLMVHGYRFVLAGQPPLRVNTSRCHILDVAMSLPPTV